ncbi:twin-arginine translocase subunit TatC [bacterium]|nr:twin-arginine translocase subunit TatC [bacterium]
MKKEKKQKKPSEPKEFLEHLDQLRKTVMYAAGGLVVGMMAMYYFAPLIQDFLTKPILSQEGVKLSLLTPTEGFVVRLKISFVAGLFFTAWWIFLQIWLFVMEGLYSRERKMLIPVVFFSSFNFLVGAGFGWLVLPWATDFFMSFSTNTVENMWSLEKYLDFVLRMFVAFGVVFELPLVIYFLARFGIVTPEFLRKYRRHAYISVLIAASIITPPDVFTQVVLGLPMVVLYEISIWLAVYAEKKSKKLLAEMESA